MKCLYLLLASMLLACCSAVPETVRLFPGEKDYTPLVRKILEEHPDGDVIIEFAQGRYDFYPEKADTVYARVSNNDNGVKRVAFILEGMDNVRVQGDSSEFLFHGAIVPFYVRDAYGICLEGINIDYSEPFILEADIIARDVDKRTIDIEVRNNVKCDIIDGRLYFSGYDWTQSLGQNIVFDPEKKAPIYKSEKYLHMHWVNTLTAECIGENKYRLGDFYSEELPPVGAVFTDKGPEKKNRLYPGIIVQKSSAVELSDMNVFSSGAMALICENSEMISLERFNVLLRDGSDRMVSSTADATHFVSCRGKISINDCVFENMLDDAVNVHGVYMAVDSISQGNIIYAHFGHFHQDGFEFAEAGDTLRLVDRSSLKPLQEIKVDKVIKDSEYSLRIFSSSDVLVSGDRIAVENPYKMPQVEMRNCIVKNNRARGVLFSTSAPVLMEGNYIEPMMAGVLIAGDSNKWFESGGTGDIVIRDNEFVNVATGGACPQSVLQVSPEIPVESRDTSFQYHRNIIFENNIVRTFDSQVIYALSVDGMRITGNRFFRTYDYAPLFPGLSYIDLQYCRSVDISGNTYEGNEDVSVSVMQCRDVEYEKHQQGFCPEVISNPNRYFYQQ